jgi:ribosomal protein L37E
VSGITGKDNTMRTCRYCGKRSSDDSKFCIDCGAPFDGSGENNKKTGTDFEGQAKAIFDTPDHTSKMDPNDIYTNKAMALLSYIGILVLIPLFAAKDSAYTRFHASQGLTLFIIEIAYTILNRVVMSIFGGVFIIGPLFSMIFLALGLALLGLSVFGIICVAQNKAKELPFIGSFHIVK